MELFKKSVGSLESFERNKEKTLEVLGRAIERAFDKFGDDVKCVNWFSSKADLNISKKYRKTA